MKCKIMVLLFECANCVAAGQNRRYISLIEWDQFPNVYTLNIYNRDLLSLYDQQFIYNQHKWTFYGTSIMKQNRDIESVLLEWIY